jgi:hypothetical protein
MNTLIKVLSISIMFSMIRYVRAAESGLLLGFRYGANYDVSATLFSDKKVFEETQDSPSYRTFLLRAEKGQVKLAAERTNLLVPRDDGFWRIDVKHSIYNDFTADFVWINPAPDPDALPNPFLAEQEGIDAFDVSLLVKEQVIDPGLGEYCNGHAYRDILFIGNDYLSVGYTRREICRGFIEGSVDSALQMLSLAELERVNITTHLDSEGNQIFTDAAKDYRKQHSGSEDWGDVSGGIVRHQGQWVIKGHFPIRSGKYTHFDVPAIVPKNLVIYDKRYPDWKTIKKHVPDAVDAFSSPAKDLLVVLTESDSLLAFTIKKGKISRQPVLHILFKQPVSVVMARWAEGLMVSNWAQEIQNLGPKPQQSWFTEAELPSQEEAPKTLGVVVTQNTTLNIRQGIGQHTKPIAKAKKGSKVNVLDVLGQWYKVELDDGLIGYAHGDYVKILPKLPYIQPACPVDNCNYGKWQLKKSATLYAEPSFKADSLATLKAKQIVHALEGKIHTSQFGEIEVVKSELELTDDNQKLTLRKGDRLFDLEEVGLDMHRLWYNGDLYYLNNGWDSDKVNEEVLWGEIVTDRKTHWWVKVNVPEIESSGWIANPDAEGMNGRP